MRGVSAAQECSGRARSWSVRDTMASDLLFGGGRVLSAGLGACDNCPHFRSQRNSPVLEFPGRGRGPAAECPVPAAIDKEVKWGWS